MIRLRSKPVMLVVLGIVGVVLVVLLTVLWVRHITANVPDVHEEMVWSAGEPAVPIFTAEVTLPQNVKIGTADDVIVGVTNDGVGVAHNSDDSPDDHSTYSVKAVAAGGCTLKQVGDSQHILPKYGDPDSFEWVLQGDKAGDCDITFSTHFQALLSNKSVVKSFKVPIGDVFTRDQFISIVLAIVGNTLVTSLIIACVSYYVVKVQAERKEKNEARNKLKQ